MVSLRSSKLSFTYSDRVPLIRDVTVHLEPGWTGLVGANGAGKSTFLRLLHGELEPQEGQLVVEPRTARVVLCRQDVEHLDPEVEAFAWQWDRLAQRLRGELGLEVEDLERWPTLSPGERRRWQIGAALASEPEVLLLDEPTNHLDSDAREHLLAALGRYPGLGIVVSHDRLFLNALTRHTLRLHDGGAWLWPGNYDDARANWTGEEAARHDAYDRARREERKLRRRLVAKREQQGRANGKINGRRKLDPRDHDARGMAAKNRVRAAENRLGREVGVLRRQHEKSADARASFDFKKDKGRSLFVDFEPSPRQRLLSLDAAEVRAGDTVSPPLRSPQGDTVPPGGSRGGGTVVLRDVHLTLDRGSRVHIAGTNGSGKTTLLGALAAASTLPAERLLYLPQELTEEESCELLETVRQLPSDERGRVLELVAALGVDPARLLDSERPSPGEARKLMMAFGLGRRVWALLLDEPTNHLDLPAIERLEEALGDYPGALVLVTHDADLARAVTDEEWTVRDGEVT